MTKIDRESSLLILTQRFWLFNQPEEDIYRSNANALPASAATARENGSTSRGAHTLPEAMGVAPFAIAGLVCSFHG